MYSAKVAMLNDPFWFQILIGTVSTLTGQANNCCVSSRWRKASSHFSDGRFAPVCIIVGQIRWSMSVVLLSRELQISPVVFSLR